MSNTPEISRKALSIMQKASRKGGLRDHSDGGGGPSGRPKRGRKRLIAYVAIVVLLTVAILLYLQLGRISAPPGVNAVKDVPVSGGARAIWRFSIYGVSSNDADGFFFPYQAAQDPEGRIFVTDTGNSRILYFSPERKYLGALKGSRDGKVRFDEPLGLTFDEKGNLYIADRGISKLVILDASLKLKKAVAEAIPISPNIGPDGRLYVTSYDSVGVYTLAGRELETWGTRGRAPGDFDFPNGLVFSNDGRTIYVSDSNNHRVQALDGNGRPKWAVGKPVEQMDERPAEFDLPAGIARDDAGFLYVVDAFDASIRILDATGRQVAIVGDFGTADGLFSYPVTITHAGKNRFLVGDRGNGRIQGLDIFPPSGVAVGDPDVTPEAGVPTAAAPGERIGLPLYSIILLLVAAVLGAAAFVILRKGRTKSGAHGSCLAL